ncbi:MAG: NAD-dependent epimerase/dehydratase family protein [Bacteroidetes bacterium]|nr:NAD-dependent epimerase/dehydratase family protein [Bacteroidota bacterium]
MIQNVLITGVAGFIGSNLLDHLILRTNWKITGVDNLTTGSEDNIRHHLTNHRFKFIKQRCSDIKSLKEFDCIFHLAALPRIQPSFDLIKDHVEANLVQGIHLIELMVKEKYFPRFVYSGSSAIYGNPKLIPTNENESIKCMNPYAFQKYELEKYLELISVRYPSLNYVVLRYFNPYGPRSFNPKNPFNPYSSVVGIFLNKWKEGKPLLITGDGSQQRDFIHIADLTEANYSAAVHPEKLNTAFNIGNSSTTSILELAKIISDKYEFIPKREGEADITFADISKAISVLNWKPTYILAEYISDFKKKHS